MKNCVGIRAASSRVAHRTLPYRMPLLRLADAPDAIAARIFSLVSVKIILDNF
ncbi:MAG: hypothetical protein V7K35_12380 [Nostoc sp.]|uniref:hypothetical protein n=1 Tax=Nostoc sp. TaxID=1180 RepID=UPI002FFC3822